MSKKSISKSKDSLILLVNYRYTLEELVRFSEIGRQVIISEDVMRRVTQSREALAALLEEGKVIYDVNTRMGGFVDHLVPLDKAGELQNNLINSVATNVGSYFDDIRSRAAFLSRIISLSQGNSALSPLNFKKMVAIYNVGIIPCIPEKGSLGTSGDLGPLAAIALTLTGQWKAKFRGEIVPRAEALSAVRIEPLILSYKEGLALINGTSAMVGLAALNVVRSQELF